MNIIIRALFYVWINSAVSLAFGNELAADTLVYHGTSDASAAVAIGRDMFIVADDENNTLRVYKTTQGGLPLFSYDMTEFLDIEPKYPEADIEGATIIGRRIYWISSHGRNKDGKTRPNRYRFFITIVLSCAWSFSILDRGGLPTGPPSCFSTKTPLYSCLDTHTLVFYPHKMLPHITLSSFTGQEYFVNKFLIYSDNRII